MVPPRFERVSQIQICQVQSVNQSIDCHTKKSQPAGSTTRNKIQILKFLLFVKNIEWISLLFYYPVRLFFYSLLEQE